MKYKPNWRRIAAVFVLLLAVWFSFRSPAILVGTMLATLVIWVIANLYLEKPSDLELDAFLDGICHPPDRKLAEEVGNHPLRMLRGGSICFKGHIKGRLIAVYGDGIYIASNYLLPWKCIASVRIDEFGEDTTGLFALRGAGNEQCFISLPLKENDIENIPKEVMGYPKVQE